MRNLMLLLLVLPSLAFMLSGCENSSNAQQEPIEIEILAVDFLQNITSGTVVEKVSDTEYMLELELSPNTIYVSDLPLRTSGSMTTEKFYENFNINFPEEFPNALLAINEAAAPSSLTFELKDPSYDPETGTLEVIILPLEVTSDTGSEAVDLIEVDELISPFGQSSLFIDDAANSCAGLTEGTCSMGNSAPAAQCTGGMKCCFMDEDCADPGATCNGGSTGECSVSGQICLSNNCCTTGICLLDAQLPGL